MKASHEAGGSLALRALGRGSLYAFGGFSVFCVAVWKLSGASSVSSRPVCLTYTSILTTCSRYTQGDHLSGKPGNVREFDSCQGNVRDFTKSQGYVREKIFVREKLPKTVYCKLQVCVHTGI